MKVALRNTILGALAAMSLAAAPSQPQTESYKNLIEKARNLALQHDRLQASQVLQRGLKNESKTSQAYKEMSKSLEDLMNLFYTEKGQSLFSQAEAASQSNPRSALDSYQAALRAEDGNVSVLKALARTHLMLVECDKADTYVKQAEAMNPYSAEMKLLKIQVADCQGTNDVTAVLGTHESELLALGSFTKSFSIKEALRKKDLKKAKTVLGAWEQSTPDYPEVFYWRWRLASESVPPVADRAAGAKYVQLCQNLSTRKKKTYGLDVDLCRNKEKVEEALKEGGLQDSVTGTSETNG